MSSISRLSSILNTLATATLRSRGPSENLNAGLTIAVQERIAPPPHVGCQEINVSLDLEKAPRKSFDILALYKSDYYYYYYDVWHFLRSRITVIFKVILF